MSLAPLIPFFAQPFINLTSAYITSLFTSNKTQQQGTRLDRLFVQTAHEGQGIPQIFGRCRVGAEIIWASNFTEHPQTTQVGGGKGVSKTNVISEFTYSVSLALGLCEGEISHIGRIWADGELFDLNSTQYRLYKGDATQQPDPLIEMLEGQGNTPAYRHLAYLVFEDLNLAAFGNRIPQFSIEVFRIMLENNDLENLLKGVCIIPGSGEFAYATNAITRNGAEPIYENLHLGSNTPDAVLSIEHLKNEAPNIASVALVVSWFGDDLRAGHCTLKPACETANRSTKPDSWVVNNITRANAHLVSNIDGKPNYGGTPSDKSVIDFLQHLQNQGLVTTFYPFILMDIPLENTLPDPYTGNAGQGAFAWRGRITASYQTSDIQAEIDAFFGTAQPEDFNILGNTVSYTGAVEWSYRRMILHYAHLVNLVGGVECFVIGSELRGLTRLQESNGNFPAVTHLKSLAADVRSILGNSVKITYSADWSEYGAYVIGENIYFPLDDLWADSNIDHISLDWYAPLTDWQDNDTHLDTALAENIYDIGYLQQCIEGGIDYDYYYVTANDKNNQIRTNITDGTYNKAWIFRSKDIRNWWLNQHYPRINGVEQNATAWIPQSKPIWLMELGCPAVHLGANGPNLFVDAKSSENALPPYSDGTPDSLMQRRLIEAYLAYWQQHNPTSNIYNEPMLNLDRIHIWAWDARPYPAFPVLGGIWSDTTNYMLGHWLNGRLGLVSLYRLINELYNQSCGDIIQPSSQDYLLEGTLIDGIIEPQSYVQDIAQFYQSNIGETGNNLQIINKKSKKIISIDYNKIIVHYTLNYDNSTNIPNELAFSYFDIFEDYKQSSWIEKFNNTAIKNRKVLNYNSSVVLNSTEAEIRSRIMLNILQDNSLIISFILPQNYINLDVGDVVELINLPQQQHSVLCYIQSIIINEDNSLNLKCKLYDTAIYQSQNANYLPIINTQEKSNAELQTYIMDLPLLKSTDKTAPYIVSTAAKWQGAIAVYHSTQSNEISYNGTINAPITLGFTDNDFYSGCVWRFDNANALWVILQNGVLESRSKADILNGANAAALYNSVVGEWEIIQFLNAELVGMNKYKLNGFLRGQLGTEHIMANPLPANAPFVLLNSNLFQPNIDIERRFQDIIYHIGFASEPIENYVPITKKFKAISLRPLSVVHIKQQWLAYDRRFTWIRRSRIAADSFEGEDIPLGEEKEQYCIQIFYNNILKRTEYVNNSEFTYTVNMQHEDFNNNLAPNNIEIKIKQYSNFYN